MARKLKDFVVFSVSTNTASGNVNYGRHYCFIPINKTINGDIEIKKGDFDSGQFRYMKKGCYKLDKLNTLKTAPCYFKNVNDVLAEIGRFCKGNNIKMYEVVSYHFGPLDRLKFCNKS